MEFNDSKLTDIIDNYLYEVTRRLPEKQRKDIENELRGLIEDMLNERTSQSPATIKDLEFVLNELGKPRELANKYRDYKRYLIGPEYFDKYVDVLKIVMRAVFLGATLGSLLSLTGLAEISFSHMFSEICSTVISALLQAFSFVTIGFAIAERYYSKSLNKIDAKKEWSVDNLSKIPHAAEKVSIWEPIVGITFSVLFLVLINFAPQYIGLVKVSDSFSAYTYFNLDVLNGLLPFFNAIFILIIFKEIVKLIIGKYTFSLAIGITVLNIISLVFIIFVFTRPNLYNPDAANQIANIFPVILKGTKISVSDNISVIMLSICTLATALDTGKVLYRGQQSRRK